MKCNVIIRDGRAARRSGHVAVPWTCLLRVTSQGDKLMRQPNYMPDRDQLIKDLHGDVDELDDVAPDAVAITVDEYLNPQDVNHRTTSPTDVDLSPVSTATSLSCSALLSEFL